jgi:hypothetical protein
MRTLLSCLLVLLLLASPASPVDVVVTSTGTIGGPGIPDGDKGDITVSTSGTVWTIDTGAVTYAKIQNVSATARLLGRSSAGAGPMEELTAAQVKTLLGTTFGDIGGSATDAQIPDLNTLSTGLTASRCVETDGTGKLGVAAGVCGAGGAGLSDGDKGDITVSASGTVWTIDTGAVVFTKIQTVPAITIVGRNDAVTGPMTALTMAQVKTMLGYTFGDLPGAIPDAQVPDLNTLSTGLATGRCVETDGAGHLSAAANPCGVGGAGGGDVTSVGSCTTGECFTPVAPSATLSFSQSAAPATPAAGQGVVWFDTTGQTLSVKTNAGTIKYTVLPKTPVANQFVTGLAADGTFSSAQPSSANLSDVSSLIKTTGAQKVSGLQVVPRECTPTVTANAITPDINLCDDLILNALAAGLTINAPVGTGGNPACNQQFSLRIKSAASRTLTHSTASPGGFSANGRITLPTATTGDALYDFWLYRYNCDELKWNIIANNQLPPAEITVGEVDGSPSGSVNSIKMNNGTLAIAGKEATITFPAGGGGGGTGTVNLPVTGVQLSGLGGATPAVIDSAPNNRALAFDSTLNQCAIWDFTVPADYTGTPVWKFWYGKESNTNSAATVQFDVRVMKLLTTASVETDAYDSIVTCLDSTTPAAIDRLDTELGNSCTLTSFATAVAGNAIKLKVCHNSSDSVTGLIRMYRSAFYYTR